MKKIKKILILFLISCLLFLSSTFSFYAKAVIVVSHDDGGVGASTDLSSFTNIRVNSNGTIITKLPSVIDTSYENVISNTNNSNDVMGRFKTDFEFFKVQPGSSTDTYLIISFKLYVEPFDNVKYKNGIFDWSEAFGDSATNYISFKSLGLSTAFSSLEKTGPGSTLQTGTKKITIGTTPISISDGNGGYTIVYMPTYSEETTTSLQSVMVRNSSQISLGNVNVEFYYPNSFGYRYDPNIQYGYYTVRIANGIHSYQVLGNANAKFTIAEGDFWGCATGVGTRNYAFWVAF
jgi:hypothetical protein